MEQFLLDIDLLPINIAIYKKEGNDFIFVAFNKSAERTENIDRRELLGCKLIDVFPSVIEFGLYDVLMKVVIVNCLIADFMAIIEFLGGEKIIL